MDGDLGRTMPNSKDDIRLPISFYLSWENDKRLQVQF